MERVDVNNDFLALKRQKGDFLADAFLDEVFNHEKQKLALQKLIKADDTNFLKKIKAQFKHPLIQHAETLPDWANLRLMQEGAVFFARYAEEVMNLLGLLSLPYTYAGADGARVLLLSGKMQNNIAKRLNDTANFVWDVMSPKAFNPGGIGFSSVLKVRLIHAAIRFYLKKDPNWEKKWGVPVNQEDMAGTNLSFSLLVLRGLRKLGYTISLNQKKAFLHLWAVIGTLSGVDDDLVQKDLKSAQVLEALIAKRQFKPSAQGQALTKSLIDHILSLGKDIAQPDEILGLMRYLLGDNMANMLNIPSGNMPSYKINLLQTKNMFKQFDQIKNSFLSYQQAYRGFKKVQSNLSDRAL